MEDPSTTAQGLLGQFKAAFFKEPTDQATCNAVLPKLKIILTKFNSLLASARGAADPREILIAREVYEFAALLSVKSEDLAGFERHIKQLNRLYIDYAVIQAQPRGTGVAAVRGRTAAHTIPMPPSERQNLITGLYLLFLLSQNRVAEFHTELEQVSAEAQDTIFIKHPVLVEQHLMEGSYNRVVAAAHQLPAQSYSFFMKTLLNTVRDEIADCCESAYERLPLDHAARILMCESVDKLFDFLRERRLRIELPSETDMWRIMDDSVILAHANRKDTRTPIRSLEIVEQSLAYTRELERIV